MSNVVQVRFREIDYISSVQRIEGKSNSFVLGCGLKPYLVRVFLLQVRNWSKCSEEFDLTYQ